ncbi:MAG: ATP synthase F1 subunit epsilon [Candidatus Gracilibacteria bacterium]|nr:ATP synthase F1 subunit epsilon [Candidatus Gracilibacteria bacterium]
MKLEILSFTGNLFKSDDVVSVTAMTKVGEVTILDNHTPLVSVLKPSTISVIYNDAGERKEKDFAIGGGVLEVSNSQVKLLIDMLVSIDELDVDKAEKARLDALAMIEKYKNSQDKVDMEKFIEAEDMLLRSIAQLKLYNLKK